MMACLYIAIQYTCLFVLKASGNFAFTLRGVASILKTIRPFGLWMFTL